MKILVLYNRLPFPLTDGGNLAVDALMSGLKSQGNTVHLLAMHTTRHPVDEATIKDALQNLDFIKTVLVDNDIKVLGAIKALIKKESYNISRFISEDYEQALIQMLENNDYDIVQFEGLFVTMYAATVKQYSKAKAVYRQHNIEYKIWENNAASSSNFLKKGYLKILAAQLKKYELQVYKSFDWILPISRNEMIENEQLGFKGVQHWTPFGISKVSNDSIVFSQNVYHIGAMDWLPNQQGVDWFIQSVWPIVLESVPQAQFNFAGRNMPARFYEYNNDHIFCAGTVADAAAFEATQSILIVPLQAGAGIRIKTLMAMAQGKAVVSTTLGANGLGLVPEVHLLIADDAMSFAQHLIDLLKRPSYLEKIANAGKEFVEQHYLNDNIINHLLEFYKKVIHS